MRTIIKALALNLACFGAPAIADEFKCAYEKDTAPQLDHIADDWFTQARRLSKERLPDWVQVAQLYQKAIDKDHWKAMHNLAELYLRGKGVAKDTNKAVDLYQRMLDLEAPLGYYDMGVMVQRGVGVIQSDKDAMLFFLKAADMGSPHAQTRIGYIYIYDKNQDAVGLGYLKCAAMQDFPDANYKLASYNKNIDANYPVAMHYYQRAAALGDPKGAMEIEDVFREGSFGYEKNEKLADAYSKIYDQIDENPDIRFPDIAKEYPLPPHPIQGYHGDKDINWKPTGRGDDY